MKDCLRKMEALVRNDFDRRVSGYLRVELKSCMLIDGNTEALFIANGKSTGTWLYDVIYYQEYNDFRVFMYRYVGMHELYVDD